VVLDGDVADAGFPVAADAVAGECPEVCARLLEEREPVDWELLDECVPDGMYWRISAVTPATAMRPRHSAATRHPR
jgi:hypothetical protein